MRVFRDLAQLPVFQNTILTIGSFDGVHRGHQQLLARIQSLTTQYEGDAVVVTFDPHPRQIVYPQDDSLRLITTTEEKVDLLAQYGVAQVVIVPFTVAFSQMSADEYIHDFLVGTFHPRCIVIGYDHRFGLNRQGNIDYLRWHGAKLGYELQEIERWEVDQMTVSSTKIRRAIEQGDIRAANRLLGHPFRLTGQVVHGQQIGRSIGFPTANLHIDNPYKIVPAEGIYAVRVLHDRYWFDGMLYIGKRPTLTGNLARTIEVNIFDFNEQIYGETLRVDMVAYIRDDVAFDSLAALRQQLGQDRVAAQRVLSRLSSTKS